MSSDFPVTVSIQQLAKFLDIHRDTISKKLQAAGLTHTLGPKNSKLFDTVSALKIILADANATSENSATTEQDKQRLIKAKADTAELDLQKKQGKLVDATFVINSIAQEYALVRTQLLTIPNSLAVPLAAASKPEEVQTILSEKINSTLLALTQDATNQLNELQQSEVEEMQPVEQDPDETEEEEN